MSRSSTTDVSALERYFKQLSELSGKEVEYGFYGEQHYSGLNMATLAAIHEQGWNNLPERNFMFSTSILSKDILAKNIKKMHNSIIAGGSFNSDLKKIGNDFVARLRMTIEAGDFSNPKVSPTWANIKGFDNAMHHYGDLSASATYKVVSSNKK